MLFNVKVYTCLIKFNDIYISLIHMFALLMMKPYLYFSELIYIQEISVLLNTIQLDLGITNTSMFNSRS